jgi:NRAMP (natural resistance-associated macrophage protein)-like metal ion transporter
MSALVDLVLGIVTSIGGFVEAGSISTAAQAGSEYGYQLLWAVAVATLMVAMLIEMSGRLAAVSKRSLAAAVRERFGIHFQIVPLAAELIIDLLLLAAEIGGVAIAVKLVTGGGFVRWILPVGGAVWLVLWLFGFGVIEYGIGLLGLVTVSFVVSAWMLKPDYYDVLRSLVPSTPHEDHVRYAFLAVTIIGATVSPYLLNFYASGTIEEKLTEDKLWINRATAYAGIGFGGVVSTGVLVTSALTLGPRHIIVDSYDQAALMFVPAFGRYAIPLFAAALGVGCFGAAVELSLNSGYVLAQVFGWSWGASKPRTEAARFTAAFTCVLLAALALGVFGFDPLRLTLLSVALTVVIMPAVVLPFLVLMNDKNYVKQHTAGAIGNALLVALTILGGLLALVVVPLEIFGG